MKISLKAARINQNLSRSEAAEKLGVSAETIKNWERFRTYPNAIQISKIEEVYQVTYDELNFLPQNNP